MADSLYEINFKGVWHLTKQTMEQVWRVCLLSVAPSCQGNPTVSFCHAADCRKVDSAPHSSVCVHVLSWHSISTLLIHVPSSVSIFSLFFSLHQSTFPSPSPPPPLPFSPPLSPHLTPPESFDFKPLCTVKIEGADQLAQLKEAVEDLYYFEFVFGEAVIRVWILLVCGCVGGGVCVCTHMST